jgi:hypothetical protein
MGRKITVKQLADNDDANKRMIDALVGNIAALSFGYLKQYVPLYRKAIRLVHAQEMHPEPFEHCSSPLCALEREIRHKANRDIFQGAYPEVL